MPDHSSHESRHRSCVRPRTASTLAAILSAFFLGCTGGRYGRSKVVTDFDFLSQKLMEHAIVHNCSYPPKLVDLTLPDARGRVTVAKLPLDPWGRSYAYWPTGKDTYEIASWGADGTPGGTGDNEDVTLSMILAGKY